ncbi:DUF411 domain-containing protein [Psychrobacter sp. 1U2]|uniref:DUF411 domain-containing protein n=1 Tax=Psychrobacter sp. 1U2 TaxID=3453577 RepID=UPI003F45CFAE
MMTNKYHKLLASMLLFTSASTLLACSGTENTAAEVQPVNGDSAPTSVQVSQTEASAMPAPLQSNSDPTILQNVSATVYKDANCGCCKEWIGHAKEHGMTAEGQDVADLAVFKQRYGVPNNMRSCHTTVTSDGYVFEGHVPAKHVAEFLANPPSDAIGLAVPGMPMGSPGMEYNNQFDPYQIMQINKDGSSTVYAQIESPQQQL